jgi:hypothetical protein
MKSVKQYNLRDCSVGMPAGRDLWNTPLRWSDGLMYDVHTDLNEDGADIPVTLNYSLDSFGGCSVSIINAIGGGGL